MGAPRTAGGPTVLISVDMEGIAGIATRTQVLPGAADYPLGRRLMTAEADAAAQGAFDAGAGEVLVNDSHGSMDNLLGEDLDPRVQYFVGSPKPAVMMEGLFGQQVDVALMVGYHVGAHEQGVLAHTFSTDAFSGVRVNGEPASELAVNLLLAAEAGVGIGLVTGDDLTCAEAERLLPGVRTVAVKRAVGRSAALSHTPAHARSAVRRAAHDAVACLSTQAAPVPTRPAELRVEVDLRRPGAAEMAVRVPGTQRVGASTVARDMTGPRELVDVLTAWGVLCRS